MHEELRLTSCCMCADGEAARQQHCRRRRPHPTRRGSRRRRAQARVRAALYRALGSVPAAARPRCGLRSGVRAQVSIYCHAARQRVTLPAALPNRAAEVLAAHIEARPPGSLDEVPTPLLAATYPTRADASAAQVGWVLYCCGGAEGDAGQLARYQRMGMGGGSSGS